MHALAEAVKNIKSVAESNIVRFTVNIVDQKVHLYEYSRILVFNC